MNRLFLIILLKALAFLNGAKAQQSLTISINGVCYIGQLNQWGFYLISDKRDTMLRLPADEFVGFEFQDFNKDGYKDIFLEWGGNMPGRYSLYIFVPSKGKFKEIENFSDFPAAEPLAGTKYYYSYYKNGCADNAWGSHLFYIKDYKATKVGNIKGDGCGIDDRIHIYRVKGDKKTLFKTLPLNTIERYKDYKWGFIKQYWAKNYRLFV